MGLEAVELLLTTEKTFGIAITDEEACSTFTVGALHSLIVAKLSTPPSGACSTAQAFHRLRRSLQQVLQVPRSGVLTTTPLPELVPRKARRSAWHELEAASGLRFPRLRYPLLLKLVVAAGSLALAVAAANAVAQPWSGYFLGTLVWSTVGVAWLLLLITLPFRIALPSGFATVGQAAASLVRLNEPFFRGPGRSLSESEVWDQLCTILETEHRVPRDKIRPDSSFVHDLGFG